MTLRGYMVSVLVLAFVVAAGCASSDYRSEQAGVATVGKMRVTLGPGWHRAPAVEVPEKHSTSRVLSRDGLERDRLILIASIADGGAIFRGTAVLPTFRADMTEAEIATLVAKSLQAVLWAGNATVEASNARAHGFTGVAGFRFELEADVPGAADHRGIAGGFIDDNRLYVNIFLAESPEHYERHRQTAEDIIESAVPTVKTIRR